MRYAGTWLTRTDVAWRDVVHRAVRVVQVLARLVVRFAAAAESWSVRRDARRAARSAGPAATGDGSRTPARLGRRALFLAGAGAGSLAAIVLTQVMEASSPAWLDPAVQKVVEDESPLDVVAVSVDDANVHPVLFPEGTDVFADTASADLLMSYLTQRGGVAIGESSWNLVLRGNRADDVTVVDMRPVDVACDTPLNGVAVDLYPQGEMDRGRLLTQIDDESPAFFDLVAEYDEHDHGLGMPVLDQRYFTSNYLTLEHNEEVPLSVSAVALKQHCTWKIAIEYTTGGDSGEMRVAGPGGEPFEITAPLDRPGEYAEVALPYCDDGRVQISGADYQDAFPAGCPMHAGTFMQMSPLTGSRATSCDEQVAEALMNYARGWIGPATAASVVEPPDALHEILRWLDGDPALMRELRSGSTAGALGSASWDGACVRA